MPSYFSLVDKMDEKRTIKTRRRLYMLCCPYKKIDELHTHEYFRAFFSIISFTYANNILQREL